MVWEGTYENHTLKTIHTFPTHQKKKKQQKEIWDLFYKAKIPNFLYSHNINVVEYLLT